MRTTVISTRDLADEWWKQGVPTLLVWLALWVPLSGGMEGWDARSWAGAAGVAAVLAAQVLLGHAVPTALTGRLSWARSVVGLLVAWAVGALVLDAGALGPADAAGWALIGTVMIGVPVTALTIGLRILVPALRPRAHLSPSRPSEPALAL